MSAVIDIADARRRRQLPSPAASCRASHGGDAWLRAALDEAYARLGPAGAPITMPDELRRWLRCRAAAHATEQAVLQAFLDEHGLGLSATLDGACHDPDAQRLLAPELLLALLGLDSDPHSLRACWPPTRDVRELLALADLFGQPFSD